MTTSAPENGTLTQQKQLKSWGEIAVDIGNKLASPKLFRPGDLAELRRMDPDAYDVPVFWKIMVQHGDRFRGPKVERKWGLILHGIALMTPTSRGDGNTRYAHDPHMPVGRALYLGDAESREKGFYSEIRLNRLLTARGAMFRSLLARTFRMLAAADVSFDWKEMAGFIRDEGDFEKSSEIARRRIAREYFQAQYRSRPDTTENQ